MQKPELLIVDDEFINLAVLENTLSASYRVRTCESGEQALAVLARIQPPDMILLDILMPGIDGFETLSRIRTLPQGREIPVAFISALDSMVDEEKGFALGAVDYITKPFRPALVLARVRAQLELKQSRDWLRDKNAWLEAEVARRMRETQLIQDATLSVVTQLAETRDSDTANHILRTRAYIERLARRVSQLPALADVLTEEAITLIIKASPLHDIGKIGIPDAILLKPGRLTPREFAIMQTHCHIGSNAIRSAMNQAMAMNGIQTGPLQTLSLSFLEVAEVIALNHHERWDGTGYPNGLSGTGIPLAARLMALADVYDALTTPRVYKNEWKLKEARRHIVSQSGRHFDPDVVAAFLAELETFEEIHHRLADDHTGELP